jgi:SPP1 gp7 family putative phage head morphogenesis protein
MVMDEQLEEYNELLREIEDEALAALAGGIAAAFNLLLQRIYDQSQIDLFQRLSIEAQFPDLFPPLPPDQSDDFLELFEELLRGATALGLDLTEKVMQPLSRDVVPVAISAGLIAEAAMRSRGYLERHGRTLASEITGAISQGLVQPESIEQLRREFASRLSVINSRAAVVVRTESFRMFNDAIRASAAQNGVKLVVYYATVDDRTCPYCAAQAGRVFKLNAIRVPRHPNCRCLLFPYLGNELATRSPYDDFRRRHRNEVHRYARSRGVELDDGPAYFEQSQPLPVRKDGRNSP